MTRLVAIVFGVCSVLFATAQEKFTLSGYVRDSLSGETLIGATVAVNGHGKSIVSNQFGFYSITLPRGTYPVLISFAGYLPVQLVLTLDRNIEQSFYLSTKPVLQEVIVSARRRDGNVTNAQMGKIDLSITQVKTLPVVLGETDLLKTLQLLPGVRNAGEGNTGLYVRGGGPDQNLILLDDAIVYNSGHLFGFFSIFNSDAIKNISLVKGGMAAQYGGRLSSVLDVAMKEGNLNKFEVEGGIGAIASRLSIQGPIKKNKSSFIISGRRTYIDLLAKPFIKPNSDFYGSGYYFYDFNAKMNFIFSEKDRLYLSGYLGRDVFTYRNARRVFKADIPWGNSTATLRWNHVFNRKLFANTTLVYNDYAFSFGATQNDFNIKLSSGIHDFNAKTDFDYYPSTQHKIRFGAAYTYHTFTPNVLSGNQGDNQFYPDNAMKKYAGETGIYVQDEWDVSERIKVNAGLRYSRFVQLGPYKIFSTDINGDKTDSVSYGRNKPVKAYDGFEPRLTLRYAFNDETSVKAAVTRNLQYIHLVSNAGSTLPTDLWVPSTYRVKPQESWQYAAGLFKNFNNNMLETSLEVYYKRMNNQIEYREGYTPTLKDPENEFVFGKGWSYGTELFINKTKGKLTGWIGYTLSWTWRQFDTLNEGKKYPSKYDRRHDLSVVATYQLNKKWKLSGVFVYGSGNAVSLPERFYVVGGILTQEYSKINQYRLAPYHRMDISAIYTPRPRPNQRFQQNWVFSLYNVYSRLNPYFIYFSQEGSPYDGTLNIKTEQVSLFPIIPSVTWNFKF